MAYAGNWPLDGQWPLDGWWPFDVGAEGSRAPHGAFGAAASGAAYRSNRSVTP